MSDQIKTTIHYLVDNYANKKRGFYELDWTDIPEHEFHSVAGLILSKDDARLIEASGPDNSSWESLLPSLIGSLMNPNYSSEEFKHNINNALANYVMPDIVSMLDDRIEELNGDRECATALHMNRETGLVTEHRISGTRSE